MDNPTTKNELAGLEINRTALESAIEADEARHDASIRARTIADNKRGLADIEKRIAELTGTTQ